MIDYDKIVMMIYIKTYNDTYSFQEMKEYLGMSFSQLDDFIANLVKENIFEYNSDYLLQVTNQGLELLEELNLNNISYNELMVDYQETMIEDIKSEKKLEITEVYIPKNFEKKFKGYGK